MPPLYLHSASGYLKYSTLPNTTTAAHCSLRSSSATRESRCKLRVNNRTLALKRSNAKALNKALQPRPLTPRTLAAPTSLCCSLSRLALPLYIFACPENILAPGEARVVVVMVADMML